MKKEEVEELLKEAKKKGIESCIIFPKENNGNNGNDKGIFFNVSNIKKEDICQFGIVITNPLARVISYNAIKTIEAVIPIDKMPNQKIQ